MHIWADPSSKKCEELIGGSHCAFQILTRSTALKGMLQKVPAGSEVAVLKLAVGSTKGTPITTCHDLKGRRIIRQEKTGSGMKGTVHNEYETVYKRLRGHCDTLTQQNGMVYTMSHVKAWTEAIVTNQLPSDFSVEPAFGPPPMDGSTDPSGTVRFPKVPPLEPLSGARLPPTAPVQTDHDRHKAAQAAQSAVSAAGAAAIKPLSELQSLDFYQLAQHAKAAGVPFDSEKLFAPETQTEKMKLLAELDRVRCAREQAARQVVAAPLAQQPVAAAPTFVRSELRTLELLAQAAETAPEHILLYTDDDLEELFKSYEVDVVSRNDIKREMETWEARKAAREAELRKEQEEQAKFQQSFDGMNDAMSSECRGLDDDIGALAETLIGQPATLGSGVQGQSRTFLTTITHLGFGLAVGGLGTVEGYEDSGESTTVVAPSRTIPALMARDAGGYFVNLTGESAESDAHRHALGELRKRFWASESGGDSETATAATAAATPDSSKRKASSSDAQSSPKKVRSGQ